MINPTQNHWRLIRFIAWRTVPSIVGAHISHLSSLMRMDDFECSKYLVQMAHPEFSEWGPWVERVGRERWAILGVQRDNSSTGGYLALHQLVHNVYLDKNVDQEWIDNVRAGFSDVENAVIPDFTRSKKPIDPEIAAGKSNSKFISRENTDGEDLVVDGIKVCPRCHPSCKRPLHKKSQYCRLHQKLKDRKDYPRKKIQRKAKKLEADKND